MRSKKKTEQQLEESSHSHAIVLITVENNRRHNQNHSSGQIKYFFLISWSSILGDHGSRLLMKSWFTRKQQAISHFTEKELGHSRILKIPYTTLSPLTKLGILSLIGLNLVYSNFNFKIFMSCSTWAMYFLDEDNFVVSIC